MSLCGYACFTLPAAVFAADPAIPTHEFFDHAAYQGAKISPTGKYLAVVVRFKDQGETRLGIIDLADMKVTSVFRTEGSGGTFQVGRFFWVNDHRVVFDTLVKRGDFDAPLYTGWIYAGNADGSAFLPLPWPTRSSRPWFLADWPLNDTSIVLWAANQAWRENVSTGATTQLLQSPLAGGQMLVDHHGQVRFVAARYKDQWVVMTRDPDHAGWRELQRINNAAHGHITPLAFSGDDSQVFLLSDVGTSTAGIYSMDVATGKQTLLFQKDGIDPGGLVYARDMRTPIGVTFGDKHTAQFFDPSDPESHLRAAIAKAFPDSVVRFTSFTADGRQGVLLVASDRDPGQYFLVDTQTFKIKPLIAALPWVKPEAMSPMQPISLKARDGLDLHGYLTVPKNAPPKKLPMVVLVHGGPHGIHDQWGYEPEVQFLAHHGYAVLQINYRGSGGFGHEFQAAGYKRWGREMQDDVTDATRWAIEQGVADKDRICIAGGSYGGYSALMGVIREPDLYRCSVGYVGVYDLEYMYDRGDIMETIEGIDYLEMAVGNDKQDLRARSPVYNVDKIKVPVMLVAGGKDQRVPIGHFDRMVSALKASGKTFETLLKPDEMHGFYEEANNVELYDKMLDFFNRNTGPRTQQ